MKIKNIFYILIVTVVVACTFSVSNEPAKAASSSGSCGESAEWTLDESGFLTITGTGTITAPESEDAKALWASGVKFIIIEEGPSTVAAESFSFCTNLEKIQFPTSIATIESGAFGELTSTAYYPSDAWLTHIFEESSPERLDYKIDNGNCGANATWKYDLAGTIYISGSGRMSDYDEESPFFEYDFKNVSFGENITYIGANAFSSCASLKTVVVPNTVTEIGFGAFSYCDNISNLTLPYVGASKNATTGTHFGYIFGAETYEENMGYQPINFSLTLTDAEKIDDYAFSSIVSLTSITLPNTIKTIGTHAFDSCLSLKSIEVPTSVESIGFGAFIYCSNLESLKLPFLGQNRDTTTSDKGGITYIFGSPSIDEKDFYLPESISVVLTDASHLPDYSFYNCTQLVSISLNEGITSIGLSAFSGCEQFSSFTVPTTVTSIGFSAFSGCTGLTSVSIPFIGEKKDVATNSYVGYIFGGTSYTMNDEVLPAGITISVTNCETIYDYALYHCAGLMGITLPSNLKTIGAYALQGCSSIKTLVIPTGVTSIGFSALSGCEEIEALTLPFVGEKLDGTGSTHFGYIFGAKTYKDNSACHLSNLSLTVTGGSSIDNYAFYDCYFLAKISLPTTITKIGNYAFSGCGSIKSISIPKGTITVGDYAFYECALLTGLSISSTVQQIGAHAFEGCVKLSSLVLPSSLLSIGDYAFSGCELVKAVSIPSKITRIGKSTFAGCKALASVVLSKNISVIDDEAFLGCEKLASITLPASLLTLGDYAFSGCEKLTSIVLPKTATKIGYGAFDSCNSLKKLTLPFVGGESDGSTTMQYLFGDSYTYSSSVPSTLETITILGGEKIAASSFSGLMYVKNLYLPSTLESIGADAFEKCYSLTNIYVPDLDSWLSVSFANESSNPMCYAKNLYANNILVDSILVSEEMTEIGDYVFSGWKSLKDVEIQASIKTIGANAFKGCSLTVYYPEASTISCAQYGGTLLWNIIGDLNFNSQVNSDDAIRLLMHTQFPDDPAYAISQKADYNGDGQINSDDAIYLLMHTQFKTDYPLDPRKYRA